MDLSYEETMRRIAKYENDDLNEYIEGLKAYGFDHERTLYEIEKYERKFKYQYCREKTFPYDVAVYKGENRLFVVPYITSIFYLGYWMAWYRMLDDTESPEVIGKAILDAFEHIRVSPVDARTQVERDEDLFYLKETKCRSYSAFYKKYMYCNIDMNEQGIYTVAALIHSVDNRGYTGIDGDESVQLSNNATALDLGNAITNAFRILENYAGAKKPDPYPPVEVKLLSDQKVKISPPRDRHFTDCDDCGAAELYKVYKYYPQEGAESSAEFYLGIAAELDCDMTEDNIRTVWEKLYGKGENFEVTSTGCGIFTLRADMRNSKVRKVSYLLRIDESELLECTLEVDHPNKRKKTEERLIKMFEKFASECRIVPLEDRN